MLITENTTGEINVLESGVAIQYQLIVYDFIRQFPNRNLFFCYETFPRQMNVC